MDLASEPTRRPLQARVTLVARIAAIIILVICIFGTVFQSWVPPVSGSGELVEVSGEAAKRALEDNWPPSVNPADVNAISYKTQASRDTYSSWFRIHLSRAAALDWMDYVHFDQARYSSALNINEKRIEGVHRTVAGPPPLRRQTGVTPRWWTPPASNFRATEIMVWYKYFHSGVARATYSAYDESTDTLWVYEYAAQHDKLWAPRDVPVGEQFGSP